MSGHTIEQLQTFRSNILPSFNTTRGNIETKIEEVSRNFEYDKDLIYGLVNPNFDDIILNFGNIPNIEFIIRVYGRCIVNKYENGVPIDPITLTSIDYNDIVVLENTGYSRESIRNMISINMKNPMNNLKVHGKEIGRLEYESSLYGNEYINVLHNVNYEDRINGEDLSPVPGVTKKLFEDD
uniref:Uncharacterized protein n=1 Tax=viral metagenome TaxID=1070528 RepID=A0A6C0BDL4_9ZZZZ